MKRALVLVFALAACDLRKPDPSWSRMLSQKRGDAYEATSAFPDGKVLQAPPPHTVARDDDADEPAPPLDRALVELGRARYDMACANCHGIAGDGRSFVAEKMTLRKPPSLVDSTPGLADRQRVFDVTTNGYGLMPALAHLLSRRERWAVAAYVEALQLRRAKLTALPADLQAKLERRRRPGKRRLEAVSWVASLALLATLAYVASDPRRALLAWIAAFAMSLLTGISALIVVFVLELVHAKWWLAVRAPFLAIARLPIIAPLFFLPIAVFGARIYHHYSVGFLLRSAGYLAVFGFLASRKPTPTLAAPGIVALAFTLTAAAFDWLMALQPRWTASLYGVWLFAEGFCGAMAAISVAVHVAKRARLLPEEVAPDHVSAVGRLLLCSLLVWANLGFFQLLLVWLPDLPHEVTFFAARVENGWGIVSALVIARFVIALGALLSRELKRSSAGLATVGVFLVVTQALDCAWLVLPSGGARLSPFDLLPFLAVIAFSAAYVVRVARRVGPAAEIDLALRYRSR